MLGLFLPKEISIKAGTQSIVTTEWTECPWIKKLLLLNILSVGYLIIDSEINSVPS